VSCFYEGYKRQDKAFGYARAYRGLTQSLPRGLDSLEADLPYDLVAEIRKSAFARIADQSQEEFENDFKKNLEDFVCPVTNLKF
jgi:hypothetical protein